MEYVSDIIKSILSLEKGNYAALSALSIFLSIFMIFYMIRISSKIQGISGNAKAIIFSFSILMAFLVISFSIAAPNYLIYLRDSKSELKISRDEIGESIEKIKKLETELSHKSNTIELLKSEVKSEKAKACFDAETSKIKTSIPFSVKIYARCPGGGCFLSECNERRANGQYDAKDGYFLSESTLEIGPMNSGSITRGIQRIEKGGVVKSVTASVKCDPSNTPGAAGGWATAYLKGIERLIDEDKILREIEKKCSN